MGRGYSLTALPIIETQAGDLSAGRECAHTSSNIFPFRYRGEVLEPDRFSGLRACFKDGPTMDRLTKPTHFEKAGDRNPPGGRTLLLPTTCLSAHAYCRETAGRVGFACQRGYHTYIRGEEVLWPKVGKNTFFKTEDMGTFNMSDLKVSDRSAARVAGRANASTCTVSESRCTALVCQVPQPDRFMKFATLALIKIRKIDWERFYITDLAKALAQIDFYAQKAKENLGFLGHVDLISILANPSFLLYAYSRIRKSGATGIDNVLPTGLTSKGLLKLAVELREGDYKPKPTKRVTIPKADKKRLRPLGIASTKDKVVQQAVHLIIEPLFEPLFSPRSHGFRPGRSCHSALKEIDLFWTNTIWLLEFDFKQAFDTLNHRYLMAQVANRFSDRRFLKLLWSMLKVGYIQPTSLVDSKLELTEGTPQGSIISPLASNIYFHQLDVWIQDYLAPKYTKESPSRKISDEYLNATDRWKSSKWTPVLDEVKNLTPHVPAQKRRRMLKTLRVEEAKALNIPFYSKVDSTRLTYCRYADDFILGYRGTKEEARRILQEVFYFCESTLLMGLNADKTGIAHKEDGIMFLGYKIWLDSNMSIEGDLKRASRTRMKFTIPVERLYKKYSEKGYFQKGKKNKGSRHVARKQDKYVFMEPYIIIQRYNAVVRGLINYYSGSERLSNMYHLIYDLRRSAALTLAHNRKRRSAVWALKKWGPNLSVSTEEGKTTEFYFPSLDSNKRNWSGGEVNNISRNKIIGFPHPKTFDLIKSASELVCSIEGCDSKANQWHHIKHKRKVKGSGIKRMHIVASARQIPVCKYHHDLIHRGKYDGPNLKKIRGYEISE
ncbi:MAG: reverse transcriptase domain-containing protein [Cyanobacteria bacterium J06635_10]